GLGIILWAGWSAVWMGVGLDMAATTIAAGWFVIAAFGAIIAVTMAGMRISSEYDLFKTQPNQGRIQRFNNHVLSSTPLHFYVIAMAAWSFLTVEWWVINLGIVGRTLVAYGWFLIALYGLGLTISLAVKHDEAVVEELDEVTPSAIDIESP
ncbi:MAG: hypothetical protein ABEJ48_01965, partial [Halobacteriales archaeon]